MKRSLFISQPMNGRTFDQIMEERKRLIKKAEEIFEEEFEVINSIIFDAPENVNALWYLGESLKRMSYADVVIFAKDWDKYRGCIIERSAATAYGLTVIED